MLKSTVWVGMETRAINHKQSEDQTAQVSTSPKIYSVSPKLYLKICVKILNMQKTCLQRDYYI